MVPTMIGARSNSGTAHVLLLQLVASMLLDQLPQSRVGEYEICDGIRLRERARERNRAFYSDPKRRVAPPNGLWRLRHNTGLSPNTCNGP